jgi:DNA (cytosine-5)-methyltransferase 3A
MNVLSLFDGMSCTQIALKNLGIKVDKYYASEIDKYAIKVARENFPNTVHLGDIKNITGSDFICDIDLIVAGSPCQGFSFAGKQLAFDDPRSALFFEFIRLLKEVKPKYFLLENVRMKKEHMDVISQQVSDIYPECSNGSLFGIEPIKINSALVSAQNRNRLYWTNIPNIEQPKDVGLVLRDVLEPLEEWGEKPQYLKNKLNGVDRGHSVKEVNQKSNCLNATMYKGQISAYVKRRDEDLKKMTTKEGKAFVLTASYQGAASWNSIERKQRTMIPTYDTPKQVGTATDINGYDIIKRVYSEDGKSPTLTTMGGGHREPKVAVKGGALRARSKNKEGKNVEWKKTKPQQMLELRKDDKSNSLTSSTKDSLAVKEEELTWRKLTPLECERLQTVPDNYTAAVSNTQRYKMLGNGFTVKVIEHILTNMEK